MKVRLDVQDFPEIDRVEVRVAPDSPLKRVYIALAQAMQSHPAMAHLATYTDPADYPSIQFPDANATLPVTMYLTGSDEVFLVCDVDGDQAVGAFLFVSDPIRDEGFPDRFMTVTKCDEHAFIDYVHEAREQESDPHSSRHDAEYLTAQLNTFTHELAHAVEFIEHGHGLTPRQVVTYSDMFEHNGNDADESLFDRDVGDVALGRWIRPEMRGPEMVLNTVAIQVCEERVEAKGYQWLSECLDPRNNHAAAQQLRGAFEACLAWMDEQMQQRFGHTQRDRATQSV